ncbi:MAG: hypothetical protein GWP50_04180 [Proteobacteria bacterium]|nr:hypothetical protein [Pseudomonadota bacterium]
MKLVTRTDDYTIYQRRDSRYAVLGANKTPINGDEKVAILLKHELVKAPEVKQPEPEPEAEQEAEAAEEVEAEAAEEATEEAPASEEDSAE